MRVSSVPKIKVAILAIEIRLMERAKVYSDSWSTHDNCILTTKGLVIRHTHRYEECDRFTEVESLGQI
jgi:hypothetical protein